MARRTSTTYQYKSTDDPVRIAGQYGISPQELLDANPGGFPAVVGQVIKIPPPRPISPTTTPAARGGYTYRPPTAPAWMPPLTVGFNWNGQQYQNQLQQAYNTAGTYGVQQVLPGIGLDVASEGWNTVQQAVNFSANTVNAVGGQAWNTYKDIYGNVPEDVIRRIALVNPGLAYSLMQSKPKGVVNGRNVTRPGNTPFQPRLGVPYGSNTQPRFLGNTPAPNTPYMFGLGGGQTAFLPEGLAYQRYDNAGQMNPPPPGVPQTANNYQTNPALYHLLFNPNAKNKKSMFETSLKWARNAWRRKAGRGKNRPPAQQQPGEDFTLNNSLINFGASSG